MEMQSADFSSAKLESFIDDPRFILWITTPNTDLDAFWQQVQKDFPQTIPMIREAREIVLSLRFKVEQMEPDEQQLLWQKIDAEIKRYQKPVFRISLWLRSAAAILIAGLIGLSLFYYYQHQTVEIDTAYGQRKTLTLPDGSVVTMNANSKLKYAKRWNGDHVREVWIDGEAFFNITHLHRSGAIKQGERFIVHAQKLNVEVLGTSFDVHNRRGLVKVALITGSVRLNTSVANTTGIKTPGLNLRPGDFAEYRRQNNIILRKQVNTIDYSSWKNGVLVINDVTFNEILIWIEDNYGYKAVLSDPAMGKRKLSGRIPLTSEDNLLKMIELTMGISIEKNQATHQLIIK